MRIVAITDKPDSAYGFWRITRPFAELQKHGIATEVCWLNNDDEPTVSVDGALVILQRVLLREGPLEYAEHFVNKLRALGAVKIVYELDDDIVSLYYNQYIKACGRITPAAMYKINNERDRVRYLINQCDAVTVTTPALAQRVRAYTSKQVWVIPNYMDVLWYLDHVVSTKEDEYVRIGWAGGLRPEADYIEMVHAWQRIAEDDVYSNVKFVVAGYQPNIIYENIDLERIERRPWAPLEDWPTTMQVDIGCCTLAPTQFNICKSPIKWMEFTLSGAATVVSETMYSKHIHSDEAMIVQNNSDAWYSAITELLDSTAERKLLREVALDAVMNRHNLHTAWLNILQTYEAMI